MQTRIAILLAFFTFYGVETIAQDIFSPLSTQGIGKLRNQNFVQNIGMGGIGTAFSASDSFSYALKNPATSSVLKYTMFNMGMNFGFNEIRTESDDNRGTYEDYGLNYFSVAFVANKRKGWTFSFGLAPMSAFGFESSQRYYDTLKVEDHLFRGGINDLYLNTAFRLSSNKKKVKAAMDINENFRKKKIDSFVRVPKYQNLSFGLRSSYIFGNKEYVHNISFPTEDDLAIINTVNNYYVRGFAYRMGLNYQLKNLKLHTQKKNKDGTKKDITHNIDFDLGAYFGSSASNKSTYERYAVSFFQIGSSITLPDTVLPLQTSEGDFNLPNSFGVGFMFSKKDKWKIGADLDFSQWSDFSYQGSSSQLNDELKLSIGGSYIPNVDKSLFQRIEYRAGFNYRNSLLTENEKQMMGHSTTFGLGIPFGKSIKSMLNFAFETGKIGNAADHRFEERTYNFYFGITINELWFQQYKEN